MKKKSANWRIRNASGVIQSKSKDLRFMGADDINHRQSLNAHPLGEPGAPMSEGRRWMSQLKQDEQNLSSTILFYSGPHLAGAWPHWWRFSWLSLPIQTLSSSRNSLSDTPRYNASPLGPQHSPLSIWDCDRNFYNKISSSQEPQWWRSWPLVTDQGRKSKHLVSLGTQIFIKPGRVAV